MLSDYSYLSFRRQDENWNSTQFTIKFSLLKGIIDNIHTPGLAGNTKEYSHCPTELPNKDNQEKQSLHKLDTTSKMADSEKVGNRKQTSLSTFPALFGEGSTGTCRSG